MKNLNCLNEKYSCGCILVRYVLYTGDQQTSLYSSLNCASVPEIQPSDEMWLMQSLNCAFLEQMIPALIRRTYGHSTTLMNESKRVSWWIAEPSLESVIYLVRAPVALKNQQTPWSIFPTRRYEVVLLRSRQSCWDLPDLYTLVWKVPQPENNHQSSSSLVWTCCQYRCYIGTFAIDNNYKQMLVQSTTSPMKHWINDTFTAPHKCKCIPWLP